MSAAVDFDYGCVLAQDAHDLVTDFACIGSDSRRSAEHASNDVQDGWYGAECIIIVLTGCFFQNIHP